jgi:hypothetical protein
MFRFLSCFTQSPNVGQKICIFYNEQKMTKIVLNLFKIRKKGITIILNFLKNKKNKKGFKNWLWKKRKKNLNKKRQ